MVCNNCGETMVPTHGGWEEGKDTMVIHYSCDHCGNHSTDEMVD